MNLSKYAAVALLTISGAFYFQPSAQAADTNIAADSLATERLTAWHERMEKSAKDLGLTEEQKEKIKAILKKNLGGVHGIHQNAELSAEEKLARAKAIKEKISDEFKTVLTPEQFAKWKAKEGQTLPRAQMSLDKLQTLIESLNLSDDQKDKLKSFHEEQMDKLHALHADMSLSLSEKIEKLAAMRKETDPKMKEVLDEEQYKRWEAGIDKWLAQLRKTAKEEAP